MISDDLTIVWFAILGLALLCLYLVITSVWVRRKNQIRDAHIESIKDRLYPLIFTYLDGDTTTENVYGKVGQRGLNYLIFEEILFELAENIDGTQFDRLQQLLQHPKLFDYHKDQLQSDSEMQLIKACRYFSHLISLNAEVIDQMERLLTSQNQLLAHAAASAMMASQSVEVRIKALSALSVRKKISEMAILELLYEFHRQELDQMDEEARQLQRLIRNELVPGKHLALLIKGVAEIGYLSLAKTIYQMFREEYRYDVTGQLTEAYIFAAGKLGYEKAIPLIRAHIYSDWREVRKACAGVLGDFETEENRKALYNLLYDEDYEVRLLAVKSLAAFGESGRSTIEAYIARRGGDVEKIARSIFNDTLFRESSLEGEAA